ARAAAALLLGVLPACAPRLATATADSLLDGLFAPPTAAEVRAVETDWRTRDTGVHGYRVEWERREQDGRRTMVVSHTVGGVRHFGAVRVPAGAAGRKLPVLMVAHGGERGVTALEFFRSGPLAGEWVQVLPSYRSERLVAAPLRWYRSEGPPSPGDRDVDDGMALLGAALAHVPEADTGRVAVLGRSRGAGVALLMGIRDPRVKAVVAFSGPTDFFLPDVRRLAERAVRSRIPRLPGAGYMADSVLFALRDGRIGVARARLELLRRSPARFAQRLPPTQLHHGTADDEVPIAHAERLDAAVRALGGGATAWELHRYQGGGHRPRTLAGSRERTEAFLRRVADLPPPRR
ncbi:MAG TPA: prolyl oligopeptidase family serine peptidase, partial [Longimicrobiaceae bacterium]|nr:prolyl oligopeptidase family serine peptidase [Longimicrobiaceae bacterium]